MDNITQKSVKIKKKNVFLVYLLISIQFNSHHKQSIFLLGLNNLYISSEKITSFCIKVCTIVHQRTKPMSNLTGAFLGHQMC